MSQQWTSNRQKIGTASKELSPDRHHEQRGQKPRPLSSAGELTSHKESAGSKLASRPVPMMPPPMPMPPIMPNLIHFQPQPPIAPVFFTSTAPVPFQYVEPSPAQSLAEQQETNYQETCYPNPPYISAKSYQPSRSHVSLTSGNMQPLQGTTSCSNFYPSECSNSFPPTYGWFQGSTIEQSSQFWNEPVGVDCSAFGQQYPGSTNSYDLMPTSTPMEVAPLRFNVTPSQAATKLNPRGIKTISFRCACPKAPEKESVACQVERSVKDASTNTDLPARVISSGTNTEQPDVKVAGTNTERCDVKVAETNTEISIPGVLLEWPPYTKCTSTQVKLTETRMSTPSLDGFQDQDNDIEPEVLLEQTVSAFQERRKETTRQELKHDTFIPSKELKRIPVPQHPTSLKKMQTLSLESLPHSQHLNKPKNCISADSDFDEIYYSDDDGLSLSDEENVPAAISDPADTLVQVSRRSDKADLSSVLPGRVKSEPLNKLSVSSEASYVPVSSRPSLELPLRRNNFQPPPFSSSSCSVSSHTNFSKPDLPCLSSMARGQPYQVRFPDCLADASFVSSVLSENSSLTNQILSMLLKVNPLFALNPVAHQQAAFKELLLVKRYQTEMKLFEERRRAKFEQDRLIGRGQNVQESISSPVARESNYFEFGNVQLSPAQRRESVPAMKQEHRFRSLPLDQFDEDEPHVKNSQQELQLQDDKVQMQQSNSLVNDNLTDVQKHSAWGESGKRKQLKQSENEFDLIECRSLQRDSWISVKSGGWQRWKKMNSSKLRQFSLEENHVELDDWDDKPQCEDERPGRYILEEKVSELSLITLDDSSKEAQITLGKKESNSEMAEGTSDKDSWQQVCRRKQKREGRPSLKDKSSKKANKWKKMSGC